MREQKGIANDGRDWRLFVLKAYGVEFAESMAACPRLGALVADTSGILSASISFMAPRKHIPAHRGPFRGVVASISVSLSLGARMAARRRC
jgi:aspartate beta-hydroxylase